MQVSYRGLRLEEAYDVIFGTRVPNYWWVIHTGTSKNVVSIIGPWQRAEEIATGLAALRNWDTIDDWDGDEALAKFAERHPGEVELPEYDDDNDDGADDLDAIVPYGRA